VVLAGAILCYGGISALVIAFTMYPIALAMFKEANLPRYLIPGAIAAGCFTFAAAAFPGTPQTINVIAATYMGTTVSAAPVVGIICGVIGLTLSAFYLYWMGNKAQKNGEFFEADAQVMKTLETSSQLGENVNPFIALLPIIAIIVLLVILKVNVLVSMLLGTLICGVSLAKNLHDMPKLLSGSIENAMHATVTTGCIVGYGSVVSASAGFAYLSDMLLSFNTTPLLSFSLATAILSGAAGSGTGGLAITLQNMAPKYLAMGLDPQILHRVGTLSAIGLDTLPHNGAVVVLLTLCGMTHKESYKPIFVVSVAATSLVMLIAVVLGTIFYPI
jgi:H+/gluconate symporter-like permease